MATQQPAWRPRAESIHNTGAASHSRSLAIWFGLALVLLIVVLAAGTSPGPIELRLVLLTVVASAPIAATVLTGRPDPISPVTLIGGVFLLTYGLRGWSIYLDHEPGVNVPLRVAIAYDASFQQALDLALLAITSFYVGYALIIGAALARSAPAPPRLITESKAFPIGMTCLLVGTVCATIVALGGVTIDAGGASSLWNEPLLNGANLAYAGLVLVGISVRGTHGVVKRRRIRIVGFFVVLLIGIALIAAQKATVLFTLVAAASAWHWGVRPLHIRTLGIAICIFALLFPPIQTLRHILYQPQAPPLITALQELPSTLVAREASTGRPRQGDFATSYVQDSVDSFAQRLFGVDPLIVAVALTPSTYPYLHGETYTRLPASLVPRAIWSDKPSVSLGRWFADRYWGRSTAVDRSSQTISFAGEMFINFGAVGVIIGMLLLGVAYRFWWTWLQSRWTATAAALYVVALPSMLQVEGDFVLLFKSAVNRVAVLVLVLIALEFASRIRIGSQTPGLVSTPSTRIPRSG